MWLAQKEMAREAGHLLSEGFAADFFKVRTVVGMLLLSIGMLMVDKKTSVYFPKKVMLPSIEIVK